MTSLSRGPEGSKWLAGGSGSGNPGNHLGVNPASPEAELGIGQKHQVNGSSLESLADPEALGQGVMLRQQAILPPREPQASPRMHEDLGNVEDLSSRH